MTFCIGIRVAAGVVALSDSRIVRGSEVSRKSKLSLLSDGGHEAVVMTSGLRSIRDKIVARLEDQLAAAPEPHRRMHELASAYGRGARAVRDEDAAALAAGGLGFNTNAILGGRLADDPKPALFHVYPEGNWVEVTDDTPYVIVGRTSYGTPILDRLLTIDSTLDEAVSLAYLAFDATRASANDVDFPIDVAVLANGATMFRVHRFDRDELADVHEAWHRQLRDALGRLPVRWSDTLTGDHVESDRT